MPLPISCAACSSYRVVFIENDEDGNELYECLECGDVFIVLPSDPEQAARDYLERLRKTAYSADWWPVNYLKEK